MFLAPFVASPTPVIRQMLILAELRPGEVLYDLGSGDGRAVIMAAQDFGAKSVGVEVANPRKSWKMAGHPDKAGKRTELTIGLFDCPSCSKSFKVVLNKQKI